jgi:hypothetical protein
MSKHIVVALGMCKDEEDVAERFVRHMCGQVDSMLIADNGSTDNTRSILSRLAKELPVQVVDDYEVGYRQGEKITALAQQAGSDGACWIVAADFDELWTASDGTSTIKEVLERLRPKTMIAEAQWLTHNPNGTTTKERLPKVACRYHPNLVIDQGNHFASYGKPVERAIGLLKVDHYPWRTPEQALRKIRNGIAAYRAAPDLPEKYGTHWKELARILETEGEKAVLARLGMLESGVTIN